ncbi:MAG: hypothetical protein Fur002_02680 [Anaerolineales bacterium]
MNEKTLPLKQALQALLWRRLFLPFAAAAFVSLSIAAYYSIGMIQAQQLRYSQAIGYSVTHFLEHADYDLDTLDRISSTSSLEFTFKSLEAHQAAQPVFDTIYLIGADKRLKAFAPYDPRYENFDMSRRSYFKDMDCASDLKFSKPFASLRTGQPTTYLLHCAKNGEYIVGELSLVSLQENIAQAYGAQTGTVFLVDSTGVLLAHPNFQLVAERTNVKDWLIVRRGFEKDQTLTYWRDGRLWVGSATLIQPAGWLAVTEFPAWTVYMPYLSAVAILGILFVGIFAASVRVFLLQLERKLVRPLTYLSHNVGALASGNYNPSETRLDDTIPFLEISSLLKNFREMRLAIFTRESELRKSERQYRQLIENSPDAILLHSDGVIFYANEAAVDLYAAQNSRDLVGKPILDLVHADARAMVQARLEKINAKVQALPLATIKSVRLDKTVFEAEGLTSSIFLSGKYVAQTVVRDITQRRTEEEALKYRATHDPLTDLPNRLLAQDRLEHALANAKRNGTLCAVLYLDLDNFKSINDAFGHSIGDQTLQSLAETLKNSVRMGDTVARMSGDEFVALLENLKDPRDAERVSANIIREFSQPRSIAGNPVTLSFSIGVSVFPHDGENAELLLQAADAAMYQAKNEGKRRAKFYAPYMRAQSLERLSLQNQLARGLEDNQFFLLYQPQIQRQTGKIIGVEALLRWQQPTLGPVSPERFIPIIEENGLILPIGEWALREACRQARVWQDARASVPRVAVNLSALQLKQPDVANMVAAAIADFGIAPDRLEIELTEDIVFRDAEVSFANIEKLRATGVSLAMDDFGAGFSTLGNLAHIPFDRIKIDQRLVANIQDPKDAAVVAGIIAICNNLNLEILAEGVETKGQVDFCADKGCEFFQGWYYSPAVRPEEITQYLQRGAPWEK